MKLIADLHIHSRFSMSTSRLLDPEHLDYWARLKGLGVIGTGDFTHPGWRQELREKLRPAEPGLYALNDGLALPAAAGPFPPAAPVRFLLTAEISNIYRRDGRTRKVHNLVLAPDLEAAEKIGRALARVGNVESDGRPILGLDARDLLEIVLECCETAVLVPAHIWTPWFSALGGRSGFDRLEDCFRDLSGHITAVETGLSSDPPMNRMCGFLDRFTLISNSDAHSPEKLGREANLLDTELSYDAITRALTPAGAEEFLGTVEFFPQEGKYHYDGHRKCGVRLDPRDTLRQGEACPVCGRPLTLGVMHRVLELADRRAPAGPGTPYHSLIPLAELLAEILGVGPQSRKVGQAWQAVVRHAGSELRLLLDLPVDEIRGWGEELLAEAVRRMRAREVRVEEGFDGQYGRIRVFGEEELGSPRARELAFQELVRAPRTARRGPARAEAVGAGSAGAGPWELQAAQLLRERLAREAPPEPTREQLPLFASRETFLKGLDAGQRAAATHFHGPALVIAGPGTGKTRTLTSRIAWLVRDRAVPPEQILALTFTQKAAGEMRERLAALSGLSPLPGKPWVGTFHAFGLAVLREQAGAFGRRHPFSLFDEQERRLVLADRLGLEARQAEELAAALPRLKQEEDRAGPAADSALAGLLARYDAFLAEQNAFDLDDLIGLPLRLFRERPEVLESFRRRFRWLLVDELQDINRAQYRLMRSLMPDPGDNLYAIGDPDQAIYGFRGAEVGLIGELERDYPGLQVFRLPSSYRCPQRILQAARRVLPPGPDRGPAGREPGPRVRIVEQESDRAEAEFVARGIETMLGGLHLHSAAGGAAEAGSFADFAVLCRLHQQIPPLEKALREHAIPCQVVGEVPFFKREPARSVVDFLRIIYTPENHFLLRRLLKEKKVNLGTLERCCTLLEQTTSVARVLTWIAETDPAAWKQRNDPGLRELLDLGEEFGDDLQGFLRYVILGVEPDAWRARSERVTLTTLHASKGLEFPCVFITGCEDGLLPYTLSARGPADPAEERRLLYVGMTRASRHLVLTHARRRVLYGRELHLPRSPFLDGIEADLAEQSVARVPHRRKTAPDRQLGLFEGGSP